MFQGKSNSLLPLLLSLLATLGLLGIGAGLVLRLINNGEIIGNGGLNLGTKGQSTFTQVKNVPSGLFNYGGSTTWAPIRRDVDPLLQAALPNFQLRYRSAHWNAGVGQWDPHVIESSTVFLAIFPSPQGRRASQGSGSGY